MPLIHGTIASISPLHPFGETAAGKYVIAVIDADNTVEEETEGNNYEL